MNDPPSVSVIMPARNEAATIGAQLAALARQQGLVPTEVIVADNGSVDGTLDVVRGYEGRLRGLRAIVADAAPGPSHARNAAAAVATGQVLAFCDSDDEVSERWLVELVEGLERFDLVGGTLDTERLNSAEALVWRDISAAAHARAGELPTVITANMAIRADLFRRLGMFDESFVWGHDHEFSYRLQLAGHTCGSIPGAVVHYRIKPSLRVLARRELQDSMGMAHVYATYRDQGAPRRSGGEALKVGTWLVVHVPDLFRRSTRGRWLRKAAGTVGRLVGSVRYRVWYP